MWAAKKLADLDIVNSLYRDNPLRQVVLTDKETFMGVIGNRLERLDQEARRQEAAVRRNQEREKTQQVLHMFRRF